MNTIEYKQLKNITLDGNNLNLHPNNLQPHILGALQDYKWSWCYDYEECKDEYIWSDFRGLVKGLTRYGKYIVFNPKNLTERFLGALRTSGWTHQE